VVLDDGRVVDEGTHDELTARAGLYARFAEEQAIAGALQDLAASEVEAVPTSQPQHAPTPTEGCAT